MTINTQGIQGAPGAPGQPGSQGQKGDPGQAGTNGTNGTSGSASVSGPDILAVGDSLTRGQGGGDTTYPAALQKLLVDHGIPGTVHNQGVGGEDSRTIAARQGGRPMLATVSGGQIPASGGVTVTLAGDDGPVQPLLQQVSLAGINPCTIAGVTGTLTRSGDTFTFTRSTDGSAVDVNYPAPVITAISRDRAGDILIGWWGQNDGTNDATDIIGREQAAVEHLDAAEKRWLFIGLSTGSAASRATMESQSLRAFGRRFVNIRAYLSSAAAMEDAGLTPSASDLTAIDKGSVPPALLSDAVHLNGAGYRLVASFLYARMVELGYVTPKS